MDTLNPLVSVVIPSYQHEKYIGTAIESVLAQTYSNFELIIVDDGSSDGSASIIKQYNDLRIRFYPLSENIGAVPVLNMLFFYAQGEYISLLNSDDFWDAEKLQKQVDFLNNHQEYGMVFSSARLVTQESTPERWTEIPETLFDQKNRSQGAWLRKIFFDLNFLCHPSMMIRRELWDPLHPYHCAMRQSPDLEMHIFHLKKTNLYILPAKLTSLRIMDDASNASAVTAKNLARAETEVMLMLQSFFEDMPNSVFLEGFSDLCRIKGEKSQAEIMCEQAMLYLQVKNLFSSAYVIVGLHKLYALLNQDETRDILAKEFQFTYREFFELTATCGLHGAAEFCQQCKNAEEHDAPQKSDIPEGPEQTGTDIYHKLSLKQHIFHKLKQYLKSYPRFYVLLKRILMR